MSSGAKRKPPSSKEPAMNEDDLFEASDLVFSLERVTENSAYDVTTKWSRLSEDLDYESVSSPGKNTTICIHEY